MTMKPLYEKVKKSKKIKEIKTEDKTEKDLLNSVKTEAPKIKKHGQDKNVDGNIKVQSSSAEMESPKKKKKNKKQNKLNEKNIQTEQGIKIGKKRKFKDANDKLEDEHSLNSTEDHTGEKKNKKNKKIMKSNENQNEEQIPDELKNVIGSDNELKSDQDISDNSDESDAEANKERTPIAYDSADEPKTIFVGNIPLKTKKLQIKTFFEKYGKIKSIRLRTFDGKKIFKSVQIKEDPYITAYLVFEKEIEAVTAALEGNGKEFRGAHLRVNMANGKKRQYDGKRTIFIGNLKYNVTDENLREIFQTCGEIDYVRTLRNKLGCKGIGYVCFKKPESLSLAMELNYTMLYDRPIRVERYKAKPKVPKVDIANKNMKGGKSNRSQNYKMIAGKQKFNNKSQGNPRSGPNNKFKGKYQEGVQKFNKFSKNGPPDRQGNKKFIGKGKTIQKFDKSGNMNKNNKFSAKKDVKRLQNNKKTFNNKQPPHKFDHKSGTSDKKNEVKTIKKKKHRSNPNMALALKLNPQLKKKKKTTSE